MKTKICSNKKCLKEKPLLEFNKDKYSKDGLHLWCKQCVNEYKKNYYKKYPWKRTLIKIKERCNNPNLKDYKNYGLRGIKCLITEDELKFLWYRDKAYNMKQPTIDRKDNDGNYTLENCEYIEKSLNSQKDKFKPIIQYDLNRNFIKEWNSIIDVEKKLKIFHGNIINSIKGRRKSAGGFKWKYKLEI